MKIETNEISEGEPMKEKVEYEGIYEKEIYKYEAKKKRLIPVLLEHRLISEELDFFDDYLIGGEDYA